MSSPSVKVLDPKTHPKPLAIYVPAKAGSTIISRLMITIEKFSRWSQWRLPLMTGPIRHFNINSNRFAYVIQLRNPLDHIISKYYSEGWIHPYHGNPENRPEWDKHRERVRNQSIDEYCLDILQKGRHLEQHTRIIRKGQEFGATFVTYEEMMLNYEWWGYRFLEPFHILPHNKLSIVKDHEYFANNSLITVDPESGLLTEHKREGTPGEFQKLLKPETIKILKEAYTHIIRHIIDHTEADLSFLE